MHAFLNVAFKAARKAGALMVRAIQDINSLKVTEKGINDYVTEIDHQAEYILIEAIKTAYPTHGILAEESGYQKGDDYEWVIDPLDGTKNFVHGFPHLCISMGVKYRGRLEHGLIYDPFRDELFTATRGNGARLNNYRIRVASLPSLKGALVATAVFPHDFYMFKKHVNIVEAIRNDISGMRMSGSAALNLAYVAAGRLDAFWESGLKEWDLAAGALMVREAGGLITDFDGSEQFLESGSVIAGNIKIVRQLLPVIKNA